MDRKKKYTQHIILWFISAKNSIMVTRDIGDGSGSLEGNYALLFVLKNRLVNLAVGISV